MSARFAVFGSVALASLWVGCERSTERRQDAPTIHLQSVSGDAQRAAPGATVASPLVVRVLDDAGEPVAGVRVEWGAVAGDGQISPAEGTSGADGTVSASATLGAGVGENVFSAALPASGEVVTFTERGVAAGSFAAGRSWTIVASLPAPTVWTSTGERYSSFQDAAVVGTTIYSDDSSALRVLDALDPERPLELGQTTPSSSLSASGSLIVGIHSWGDCGGSFYTPSGLANFVICQGGQHAELRTLDASDPSHLEWGGALPSAASGFGWDSASIVGLEGGRLYVLAYTDSAPDGDYGHHLHAYDLESPTQPVELGKLRVGGWQPVVLLEDGFVALDGWDRFPEIYDFSDPAAPTAVPPSVSGGVDPHPTVRGLLALGGGRVLVDGVRSSTPTRDLWDMSDPAAPALVARLDAISGTDPVWTPPFVYTVAGQAVNVYDLSDPAAPSPVAAIPLPGPVKLARFSDQIGVIVTKEIWAPVEGTLSSTLVQPETLYIVAPAR